MKEKFITEAEYWEYSADYSKKISEYRKEKINLEDRLEINLATGETVNIWIEEEPQFKEYQIGDILKVINDTIYEIDDKVDNKLAEITGIREARNKLYEAYKEIAKILKVQHPNSELYTRYNLQNA